MKNTIKILALASICLASFSCAKEYGAGEEIVGNESTRQVSIIVDVTKLTLEEGDRINWSAGDQLSVFNTTDIEDEKNTTGGYQFTAAESGASVTFNGTVPEKYTDLTGWIACYRYNSKQTYTNDKITLNLPETYSDNTKIYPRLVGKLTTTEGVTAVSMKQVGSLLEFKLGTDDITSVRIRGNNEEYLAGYASVVFDDSGNPVLADDAADASYAQFGSVVFGKDEGLKAGTYRFPVPPTVFEKGITLTFTKKDAPTLYAEKIGTSALNVGRSVIKSLGTVDENLIWQKSVQFSCIDFPTKGAKGPVWPFVEAAAKSTSPSDVKTFTTIAEGAEFHAVAQGFCANTSTGGQGVKMGNKVGDYLEFPTFEDYGLSKIVLVSAKNGNDTKKCEYCVKNGDDVVGENWICKERGLNHTWEIENPKPTPYRFEIQNEGDNLTIQRLYLYYKYLKDPSVVSVTTNPVEGAAAGEFVNCTNRGGKVTVSASFTAKEFSADAFSCGIEYREKGAEDWTSVDAGTVDTSFSVNLSGLSAKRYEYRAWAKYANDASKTYGDVKTFTLSDKEGLVFITFSFAIYPVAENGPKPDYYDKYVGDGDGYYIPKANGYKFAYDGTEKTLVLPSDEEHLLEFTVNGLGDTEVPYGPAYRYVSSSGKYYGLTLDSSTGDTDQPAYMKLPEIPGMYLSRMCHVITDKPTFSITPSVDPETCRNNAQTPYRNTGSKVQKYYTPVDATESFPENGSVYFCTERRLACIGYLELRYRFKTGE